MHAYIIAPRKHRLGKIPSNYYLKLALKNSHLETSIKQQIQTMHNNIIKAFPDPCLSFDTVHYFITRSQNIVRTAYNKTYQNIYIYLFAFFPINWAKRFITMKIKRILANEVCYILPSEFQHERLTLLLHKQHSSLLKQSATDIKDFPSFVRTYCPEQWTKSYFDLASGP